MGGRGPSSGLIPGQSLWRLEFRQILQLAPQSGSRDPAAGAFLPSRCVLVFVCTSILAQVGLTADTVWREQSPGCRSPNPWMTYQRLHAKEKEGLVTGSPRSSP